MITQFTQFTQTAVFFDWPFGGFHQGETVRFFAPVGHFHISSVGGVFRVTDDRKVNPKGGPDFGVEFTGRAAAEQWVQDHA